MLKEYIYMYNLIDLEGLTLQFFFTICLLQKKTVATQIEKGQTVYIPWGKEQDVYCTEYGLYVQQPTGFLLNTHRINNIDVFFSYTRLS